MNKPIYGVVAILLIGLIIFGALSFMGNSIKLGADTEMKTSTFAQILFAPSQEEADSIKISKREQRMIAIESGDFNKSDKKESGDNSADNTLDTAAVMGISNDAITQLDGLDAQPATTPQPNTGHNAAQSTASNNTSASTSSSASASSSAGNYTSQHLSPTHSSSPQPMDTTSKTILFFGDSMVGGIGPRLAAYAEANGHTLYNICWISSSTERWAKSPRLKNLINEFHPNYIICCLGSNELFIGNIRQKRQQYVDEILNTVGNIPFVWIGPPNWKPDTGINDMIQESLSPGSFYLSNGQHFDRQKDGAHPTMSSFGKWCDRVCTWIMTKSDHPIKLNAPTKGYAKCYSKTYRPNE